MGDAEPATLRIIHSLAEVEEAAWDACANPSGQPHNPFVSYAFLKALEESGSATRQTGWLPHHLLLDNGTGGIAGAMPLYLKSHSQGEYVFDHGWADAYERAGGRYYPKLQASVPFTPATGPRLLTPDNSNRARAEAALIEGTLQAGRSLGVSSLHVTFLPEQQWSLCGAHGLLLRTDQQFHWHNHSYRNFDDFLAALSSRKRKMIRREREQALQSGIEIEHVTGAALKEAHWDAFFDFYMDTGSRKWGRPYLTREFFSLISERMPQDILLIMAKRNGQYIAGALNFIGGDALYGRNWGAIEHHPFLHFECCYYQAIDFAIAHGLKRVEAGAQGEHKLARGYLPSKTYSAHWIADPGFEKAVANYLTRERQVVNHNIEVLGEYAPFRQDAIRPQHEEEF